MGYIPPVKDEQMIVYASRQTEPKPVITGPTPLENIEFLDVLARRSEERNFLLNDIKEERLKQNAIKEERSLTGKGTLFDQTV
ncbi:hypothetical protein MM221_01700 [Salipaludibacillus sp. LMS25]|jgi:hypothetical protein|uniref:hypothetical protein n=1 Tax=Salipaludibacillus sp. LMS25 TaxID=2924031 RepID=UPI0020D15EA8|nr:hypothetical protein [Salipaludibacillus sp. LMS25]UTR15335.1 hypothetical protein MM221_01700 [Salipaludibacillus sp. LMS25]